MSKAFNKLLEEVSGQLGTKVKARDDKSGGRTPVVSTKPRKATANTVELFEKAAKNHFRVLEKIEALKKEDSDIKDRIASICERHGVTVNTIDKAFYSHPYKAQVEYHRSLGSINAEVIRSWAEKVGNESMFLRDNQVTLDVTKLQEMLGTNRIPNAKLRAELSNALDAVMRIARAENFVKESDETYLDIEAWDKAKAEGLVPKKIVNKAEENMQLSLRVSIDKVNGVAKDRCPGCSHPVPKTRGAVLHTCKRCGTES